jgi:hypothetical protein
LGQVVPAMIQTTCRKVRLQNIAAALNSGGNAVLQSDASMRKRMLSMKMLQHETAMKRLDNVELLFKRQR